MTLSGGPDPPELRNCERGGCSKHVPAQSDQPWRNRHGAPRLHSLAAGPKPPWPSTLQAQLETAAKRMVKTWALGVARHGPSSAASLPACCQADEGSMCCGNPRRRTPHHQRREIQAPQREREHHGPTHGSLSGPNLYKARPVGREVRRTLPPIPIPKQSTRSTVRRCRSGQTWDYLLGALCGL